MNLIIFFVALITFAFFVTLWCKKKNILLSFTGDKHQKFTFNLKTPLTGGVIIFFSILFLEIDLNIKIFAFLLFLLGLTSDLKILSSANIRFFVQAFFVVLSVIFLELQIENTRVNILDHFLENKIFNIFFVSFCIIIVINGTNFADGVNLNIIIYYSLITLTLIFLLFEYNSSLNHYNLIYLSVCLLVICLLNFKNFLFLGDNGSYLLGFFFSIFLIEFYNLNQSISPFFIILLLWYPSFEILFSILRKYAIGNSPLKPDNLHLHHMIFSFFNHKNLNLNITGILINIYNLLIFLLAIRNITHSKSQILLIILNVIIYSVVYLKLYNKKKKVYD